MSDGRPKKPIILADEERRSLIQRMRRPTSTQRLALRCRIVLACAEGRSNKEVARELRVTPATVGKWRERFRLHRLAGLEDMPRTGAPRKVTEEKVQEVLRKTLQAPPAGAGPRSTRQIAKEVGLSQATILRIWRSFGLVSGQPGIPPTHPGKEQSETTVPSDRHRGSSVW